MRVLLTGATGFVGGRLAEALLDGGHAVRAIARSADGAARLADLGAEVARGDVDDASLLRRSAAGCDVLIHAAAPRPRQTASRAEHWNVSVTATEHLLECARDESVRRLVFVSTAGVAGTSASNGAPPASRQRDAYHTAKAEGERRLLEHVRRHATPAVVARLPAVYGPGDIRWVKLFRDVLAGRPWCVGGGDVRYPLLYVDDAANAIRACAEREVAPGSTVSFTEEAPTVAEILAAIAGAGGVALRPRRLPRAPLELLARGARSTLGRLGHEPAFVRAVDFYTRERPWGGATLRRELGFTAAVPLEEGIPRTLAAYRQAGWL